jgi:hypothetical protein
MRVIVQDDSGKEVFSYAPPEEHPGEENTMCAIDQKKTTIIALAGSIAILCDSIFPLE